MSKENYHSEQYLGGQGTIRPLLNDITHDTENLVKVWHTVYEVPKNICINFLILACANFSWTSQEKSASSGVEVLACTH